METIVEQVPGAAGEDSKASGDTTLGMTHPAPLKTPGDVWRMGGARSEGQLTGQQSCRKPWGLEPGWKSDGLV